MHAFVLLACLLAPPGPAQDAPPEAPAAVTPSTEDAIARWRGVLEAHPGGPEGDTARFSLGALLVERGEAADLLEAGALLEQVLAAAPAERGPTVSESDAWYLLGICRPERAAEAWARVVRLVPGSALAASAELGLGELALEAGDWVGAAAHFEAARLGALETATVAQARTLEGWAHFKGGHPAAAVEDLAAALAEPAADPVQADALQYLALALVQAADAGPPSLRERLEALALPETVREALRAQLVALLDQMARFEDAEDLRVKARRRKGR